MKRYYIFLLVVGVIGAVALLLSYALRQGPTHDADAAQDIRAIAVEVDQYYLSQNHLPARLSDLTFADATLHQRLAEYEYIVTDKVGYQLCANFKTVHRTGAAPASMPADKTALPEPENHGSGRQCFTYVEAPIMTGTSTYPLK